MADLNYIESGYFTPEQGYYVYTADANASIESTSSVTVAIGVIKSSTVELSANFTQTAVGSRTKDIDLFAFTEAAIAVTVSVIRDNNSQLATNFSVASDVSRIRSVISEEASLFDLAVTNQRSRAFNIETQAAFSFACDAELIKGLTEGEAFLSSEFTQTTDIDRIRFNSAVIDGVFDYSLTVDFYRTVDVALASEFTQITDITKFAGFSSDLTSTSDISTTSGRVRYFDSSVASQSQLSATISHIRGVDIVINDFATVTADAITTKDAIGQLSSTYSIAVNGGKLNTVVGSINSYFGLETSKYAGSHRPRNLNLAASVFAISNANPKYGTNSLVSSGSGNISTEIDNALLVKGSEDFILEFWFRTTSTWPSSNMIAKIGSVNSQCQFGVYYTAGASTKILQLWYSNNGTITIVDSTSTLSNNTQYHIAIRRVSGQLYLTLNNTNIVQVAYTGNFGYSSVTSTNKVLTLTSGRSGQSFDEVSYRKGTGVIAGYSSAIINDFETQQLLYHFDSVSSDITPDDIATTLSAAASITAQSSVSVIANEIQSGQATLTAQAALVSTVGRLTQYQSSLDTQVTLVAAGGFKIDSASNQSSEFSVIANFGKLASTAQADLTATTSVDSSGNRIRFGSAAFEAFVSTLIVGEYTEGTSVNLSAAFSLTATVTELEGTSANLVVTASVTATARRFETAWDEKVWFRGLRNFDGYDSSMGMVFPIGMGTDTENYLYEAYRFNQETSTTNNGFIVLKRQVTTGDIVYEKTYTWSKRDDISYPTETQYGAKYSNGYMYVFVTSNHTSNPSSWANAVIKIDVATGDVVWKSHESGLRAIYDIDIYNDEVYICGPQGVVGSFYVSGYSKLNSSGNRQWLRTQTSSTSAPAAFNFITVNSSYAYVALNYSGDSRIHQVNKSTGDITLSKYIGSEPIEGLKKDADNNLYVWSLEGLYKFDNSFTIANSTRLKTNSTDYASIRDISIDANGDVYLVEDYIGPTRQGLGRLIKLNSSLTYEWDTRFSFEATVNYNGQNNFPLQPLNVLLDNEQKVYVQGTIVAPFGGTATTTPDPLSITWRVKKDRGLPHFTSSIPFRDGITVYNGNGSSPMYGSGYWKYGPNSLDPEVDQTATSSGFSNNSIPSLGTNSVATDSAVVTYTTSIDYPEYIYIKSVSAFGSWSSAATALINNQRFRNFPVALTSISACSGQATILKVARAELISNSTQTATVKRYRDNTVSASATVSLSTQNKRIRFGLSSMLVEATVTGSVSRYKGVLVTLDSTANITADNGRLRDVIGEFAAIATQLTASAVNATGTVTLESQATLTAQPVKTVDLPFDMIAEAMVNATASVDFSAQSSITATASITAAIQKIKDTPAHLTVTATTVNIVNYTAQFRSNMSVTSTATATAQVLKGVYAVLPVVAQITTDNQILRLAQADLVSVATGVFIIGRRVSIISNMLCEGFTLTTGDVLNIDPYRQLKVKQETRTIFVLEETREFPVHGETRVNIIQGYQQ